MSRIEGPNDRWLPAPPFTKRLRHHAQMARGMIEEMLRRLDGMPDAAKVQPLPDREAVLCTFVLAHAARALARSPIPHKFMPPPPGTPSHYAQAMLLLVDAQLAIRCHFNRSGQ